MLIGGGGFLGGIVIWFLDKKIKVFGVELFFEGVDDVF